MTDIHDASAPILKDSQTAITQRVAQPVGLPEPGLGLLHPAGLVGGLAAVERRCRLGLGTLV
jgi:hypothetical protein